MRSDPDQLGEAVMSGRLRVQSHHYSLCSLDFNMSQISVHQYGLNCS